MRTMTRTTEERSEVMAFAVQTSFKRKEKGAICSHCNRAGHDSDSYFQVIGYPEW